jgi:hypothetical protein
MDDFFDLMRLLRAHIGEADVYSKVSHESWFTICASMDALEDTHHAISAFVPSTKPLGDEALGELYLHTYGVMQAFAIQQDAIVHLTEELGFPAIVDPKRLDHIRDFRVASVGHPTRQSRRKSQPTSSHFIAQVSLDHRGFELFSVSAAGKEVHRFVPIPDLAREQETYILEVLRELHVQLVRKYPLVIE